MKKLVLVTFISILSIFGGSDIWAQSKISSNITYANADSKSKTLRPSAIKRANELKKELALNEKQTAEVRILLNNHFEKAAEIKAKNKGQETFIENIKLDLARRNFRNDLKKILDKEQRKKLEIFREKMRAKKEMAQMN